MNDLHICAAKGSLREAKVLVEAGADLEAVNFRGETALHHAVTNPNTPDIISYLVGRGIPSDSRDIEGNTPLHTCALLGNSRNLEVLLALDSQFGRPNALGQTALHLAAMNKHDSQVLVNLVEMSMSLDDRDDMGQTAMHLCASHGNKMNMRILVETGGDIESKDIDGLTPLIRAITNENPREMIECLSSLGADINSQDNGGNSSLHHYAALGSVQIVQLLVDNGADIRAKNASGKTALHFAVVNEHPGVVEFFLDKGIPLEATCTYGATPLLCCAAQGTLHNLRVLVEKGANVPVQDKRGRSAVHYAVMNENAADIIEFLLSHGLSIDALDNRAMTPLQYSSRIGPLPNLKSYMDDCGAMKARYLSNGVLPSPYSAAAHGFPTKTLQYLLDKGADIDVKDISGRTPLLTCAHGGNLQMMELLVDKGADIDDRDESGLSSLHHAAANRETTDIMQYLLDEGMPMEVEDKSGVTPLLYSAAVSNLKNVIFLCERGAGLKSLDKHQRTALHHSVTNVEGGAIIEYLLAKGALINARDINGATPLLTCARSSNLITMKLLIKSGADMRERDEHGVSSLHYAAANKRTTEIMRYLLDRGFSLEMKDKLDRTPLLFSALNGNLKSVTFLCEEGADLKSLDKRRRTALHHAAANLEGGPIIEYLLSKGIPVDVQDEIDESPLYISKVLSISENEKILLENIARLDLHLGRRE